MSLPTVQTPTTGSEARRAPTSISSSGNPPTFSAELSAAAPGGIKVIRRNGKLTSFDNSKISLMAISRCIKSKDMPLKPMLNQAQPH